MDIYDGVGMESASFENKVYNIFEKGQINSNTNFTVEFIDKNKNVILGYWTSSLVYNASGKVWHVSKYGALNNDYIIDNYDYGIRPVISVKKYIIK